MHRIERLLDALRCIVAWDSGDSGGVGGGGGWCGIRRGEKVGRSCEDELVVMDVEFETWKRPGIGAAEHGGSVVAPFSEAVLLGWGVMVFVDSESSPRVRSGFFERL